MARKDSIELGELNDSAFYILLSIISEKHGYLIMKNIQELTNNKVTIGPASIYTTLKKLLSAELADVRVENNVKKYKITKKGYALLEQEINRKKEMIKLADYCMKN